MACVCMCQGETRKAKQKAEKAQPDLSHTHMPSPPPLHIPQRLTCARSHAIRCAKEDGGAQVNSAVFLETNMDQLTNVLRKYES